MGKLEFDCRNPEWYVTELLNLPRESRDEHSKATNSKSFQLLEFCPNQINLALHQVVDENLKEKPSDCFT